ncbi:MAG: MBL fold metallo-hydrolase [Acidobacteriota bacterium]
MFVAPLGSGSAGNSYYFESEGTSILVDAGFGPRETARRLDALGVNFENLDALVITHEHSDHIRGAAPIARALGIPVYLTAGTLRASNIDPLEVPTVKFRNNTSFRIGELQIHACRTIHDAADPSCFVVEDGLGTRVGVASDLGVVDNAVLAHLSKCDGLFFESNHDLDLLRTGTYPWGLKRRIMSRYGHLSNDDSMSALKRMIGSESKTVCLIHLSEKNNHESIVRSMAESVIAETGAGIDLQIARQSGPLPLLAVVRSGPPPPKPLRVQLSLF